MAGKATKAEVNNNALREPDFAKMMERLESGEAPAGDEPADKAESESETDSRGLAKVKLEELAETSDTSPENATREDKAKEAEGEDEKAEDTPDESVKGKAETPPAPPAKAPKAETPAPVVDEEIDIVIDGQVAKLKKSDVVKLAQQGFDYGRKSNVLKQRETDLLQKADDLEKLLVKLGPHKEKLDALIAEEREKEANDPGFGALREAREAKANLAKLEARIESEKAQVTQQAAIANLNARIEAEESKHPAIVSLKEDPEAANMIRAEVYRRVGHLKVPLEQAVAGVAKFFGGVPTPANGAKAGPQNGAAYAKLKLADARRSPVPGKGAPSSMPSKKKFTAEDAKNGTLDKAIADYLKTVDAP